MADKLMFQCTALSAGKKGVLKKDADGYREIVVGGLNVYNSMGDYYPYEGVQELFAPNSSLFRRISTGCLKGEEGHPKFLPGMTEDQYAERVMTIEETRVCAHIAEIKLDFTSVSDELGRPVVAIIAKMCGSGPYGEALEKSFDNGKENVCFSIRALTENVRIAGKMNRYIRQIITWDRVTEPGISIAKKFNSPALEGFSNIILPPSTLVETNISTQAFINVFDKRRRIYETTGIVTESAGFMSSDELFSAFRWSIDKRQLPTCLKM